MLKLSKFSMIFFAILTALIVGCTTNPTYEPVTTGASQEITGRDLRIVTGQTIYVPAYSEVLLGRTTRSHELVVTLAVHNTEIDAPIILQSVRYYDTNGDLIRNYVDDPVEVRPLATTGFVVEAPDTVGGWGANFIVEWVAEEPVSEPIVEAVMVSRSGTQGISMISLGRVISQADADEVAEPTESDETADE